MNAATRFTLLIFYLLISVKIAYAQQAIQHVEPLHWWTGMKNQDLQLMVYGKNIASLEPALQYEGVSITNVNRVKNPNYLFIDLVVSPQAKPGTFNLQFRQGSRTRHTYKYSLLARNPNAANRQGYTAADVMYLITPDRFVNGNPANDNVKGMRERADRTNPDGRHGGDIAGIIKSLPYLDSMGFTAMWVNPVLENDQPAYSYHGYSTTDFYKVDPRFGTNEEYRQLSALGKQRGIKLIMDMIVNHCGSEHWWMKDLPTDDWINFSNTFAPTNHKRTAHQDPYVSQRDARLLTDGWFVKTMPDLNQRNPFMARYLIQNSIWWIEYADLAGIRMDTYPYPDREFMNDWSCQIMAEYPNFNIVGEEWSNNPAIVAFWQQGKVNPNGYTSCLPGLMDFPIQEALVKGLTEKDTWSDGWIKLYETLANDFQYSQPDKLVIFGDNHDMDRFFSQVNEDLPLYKLGLAYLLTMRGIPQVYYGTEALMINKQPGHHSEIRTDFPGGWAGDPVNALTGKGLTPAQEDASQYLRQLLLWRKTATAVHTGKLLHFAPENGVYVYFRYTDQQKIMVVLNKNAEAVQLPASTYAEILGNSRTGRNVLTGQQVSLTETLTAPASSPLILEIE
jgi:neopullulanase